MDAVRRLAARQRAHVARRQLLASGMTPDAIRHRLRTGALERIHRGVYRLAGAPRGPLEAEMAALLAAGEDAVLSHRSAAGLWEIGPPPAGVDVLVSGGARTRRGIRVHRGLVAGDERRVVDGLPLTAPARTLVDLAGCVAPRRLERAVAEAESRRLVGLEEILAALERHPGGRGSRALRALLGQVGGPAFTRSEAEGRMLELLRAGGLPAPEVNVRLSGWEVDFLWRRQRLVVEVDGYAFHSSRAAFERDRRRDEALQAAGFRVLRVTWRRMVDEPESLLVAVTRALLAA